MEFTKEELELLRGAVFHTICDLNHPPEREKKLDALYEKLMESVLKTD